MSNSSLFTSSWDEKLISKYDVSAPRYTSYPTANLFHTDYSEKEYRSEAMSMRQSSEPISLYVHVPFCENICYYCACNKIVTRQHDQVRGFLDHVETELQLKSALYLRRPVTQLHWGGGTPTFLDPAELTELMHMIAMAFRLESSSEREYAIEIDPRTVTPGHIALLKGLGFNRISMGIQDFDPNVQKAINRIQSWESVRDLTVSVRAHGFRSLSFDLIYGLPYQTRLSLEKTMDQVIELNPERIACYNYAHLPERFPSQRSIARNRLPTATEKIAMMQYIGQRLSDAGYAYLGMDHFVRANDELLVQDVSKVQRNFQGYSTQLATELVGIGPSSISQLHHSYSQNFRSLPAYYQALDEGRLPIEKGILLTSEDQLRRQIIMSIACQLRLDIPAIEKEYGIVFISHFAKEIELLTSLQQDGLIALDATELRVTETGRLMLRNICTVFDAYLHNHSTTTTFSKAM